MARAKEAAAAIKRIMEGVPLKKLFGLTLPIPIVAEAAVGLNLSTMIEIGDDWLADDSIQSYHDIQIADWKNAVKYAKAKGEPVPKRPKPADAYIPRRRRLVQKPRRAITTVLAKRRIIVRKRSSN